MLAEIKCSTLFASLWILTFKTPPFVFLMEPLASTVQKVYQVCEMFFLLAQFLVSLRFHDQHQRFVLCLPQQWHWQHHFRCYPVYCGFCSAQCRTVSLSSGSCYMCFTRVNVFLWTDLQIVSIHEQRTVPVVYISTGNST